MSWRQWRKGLFARETWHGLYEMKSRLRTQSYDLVIDAQGLIKSALITRMVKGERVGLDWSSARESLASLMYQRHCTVKFEQHAIVRNRELFSQALNYEMPNTLPDFGLNKAAFNKPILQHRPYVVFLFETTWSSKQWPDAYWSKLAEMMLAAGYEVKICAYQADAITRAEQMANHRQGVTVLKALHITDMANWLVNADGAIAVDTGFAHLSAALGIKTISIYGATNPVFTGAVGPHSQNLLAQFACSPCLNRDCKYQGIAKNKPACYETIPPELVAKRFLSKNL
jgi:heptosyltransferase-1